LIKKYETFTSISINEITFVLLTQFIHSVFIISSQSHLF